MMVTGCSAVRRTEAGGRRGRARARRLPRLARPAQDRLRVAALARGIGAPVGQSTLPRWTGVAP